MPSATASKAPVNLGNYNGPASRRIFSDGIFPMHFAKDKGKLISGQLKCEKAGSIAK
jgi:hypothetical protein